MTTLEALRSANEVTKTGDFNSQIDEKEWADFVTKATKLITKLIGLKATPETIKQKRTRSVQFSIDSPRGQYLGYIECVLIGRDYMRVVSSFLDDAPMNKVLADVKKLGWTYGIFRPTV